MYAWIAGFYGALLSIMNMMNGQLSGIYGNWGATVIIHTLGLLCVLPLAFSWAKRRRKAPWYLYGGGFMGIVTVMFVNLSIGVVGVTINLVLMLLGQVVCAAVFDHFGLFSFPKLRLNRLKVIAILVIAIGCACMVIWSEQAHIQGDHTLLAVLLSLGSGFSIVFARTSNARLGHLAGIGHSTLMNYVTGLAGSLVLFALVANFRLAAPIPSPDAPWWVYFGGPLGMVGIILINLATMKIPAVQLSVIIFLGQIASGMVIDALFARFSLGMLLGGVVVGAGLWLNILADRKGTIARGEDHQPA